MPRVPYNPGAIATPVPSVPADDYLRVQATPAAFGAQVGGAEQQAGAELGQGAQRLTQAVLQTAQLNNRNNALDATSKLRDGLNTLTSQFMQLKGQAAVDALPAYQQKVKELQSSLSQGLGNLDAQTDFKQASNWFLSLHGDKAQRYAMGQAHVAGVQANAAASGQAVNDAVQFSNDPVRFGQFLIQSRLHAEDGARFSSNDPAVIGAAGQAAYDKNARTALLAVAETDPLHAQSLYEAIRPHLSPVAAAGLDSELRPLVTRATGDKLIDGITGTGPGVVPNGATISEIMPALLHQESGTRQFAANGAPLVSSKGAVGIAQVLPSTAQSMIPGVDLNRLRTDANYNRAVGQTIFSDLLSQFKDPNLALMAYNAGPAAVDGWIKQFGDPRTGAISMQDFIAKVPLAETRGYVTGIANAIAAANGTLQPAAFDPQVMMQKGLDATAGDPALRAYVMPKLHERIAEMEGVRAVHVAAVRHLVSQTEDALIAGMDTPIPVAQIQASLPPDGAATAIYNLKVAKQAGTFLRMMRWATPAEIDTGLNELDATKAGPSNPEEFTFHQRIIAAAERAIGGQQKALLADPGAYVASNPQIAALQKKALAGNDPQAFVTWGNAVLALEDHLGVPESRQHVFSVHQAQGIVASLTKDPNADAGMALNALAEKYGALWPKAYGDLVTLGKLPPGYEALAMMDSPGQMVGRQDLQQALIAVKNAGGLEKFTATLPAAEKKVIDGTGSDVTLHQALAPLAATLRYNGAGGIRGLGMARGAVQTLAAYYASSQGMSGPAAVRRAAQEVIDAKYDFDATQRVPKGMLGPVEQAEAVTLRGLKADDLQAVSGRVPAIANERQADMLVAARGGFWVTMNGDAGVQLMMRLNNGAAFPVTRADGKPVAIRFEDVPSVLADAAAVLRRWPTGAAPRE